VVGVVHRGQPEERRDLAEADGAHAPLRVAPHLLGGQLGVPQRNEGERDEPALGLGPAPLLDHPVVVGLDAEQPELLVLGLGEGLAAEPGEGREAERRLEVVDVHVLEAGLDRVGAGAHVLVGDALHGHLVAGHARPPSRPAAAGASGPRSTTSRWAALGTGLDLELAADELISGIGARTTRGPTSWYFFGRRSCPHVGRLDHVVVDGDDPGHVGHGPSVTLF
jgi:hypothetical protein